MNRKRITILLAVLIVMLVGSFVTIGVLIGNGSKLTQLEEIKIKETSDDVMSYMENIEASNSKDIDRYIIYALEYSYNELDDKNMTTQEIIDFIKGKFNVVLTEENIEKLGISSEMVDKSIVYDHDKKEFTINKSKMSYADIAAIKIVKYTVKSIKKKKNEYVVTYNKYLVEDPYKVLNYYMDAGKDKETNEISAYLKGEAKINTIKKYVNSDNVDKFGKLEKDVVVTYSIVNDKLVVNTIK